MFNFVDKYLNNITMYRLVFYELIILLLIALFYGFLRILSFSPISLLFSILVLVSISWSTNYLFAKIYRVQTNLESVYITALILALIIKPISSVSAFVYLGWAAVLSMAAKYILAIDKKHIFNPAAIAVLLLAFSVNQSANWWIGTRTMLPFVLIGGFLIVRKIRRFALALTSIIVSLITILFFGVLHGNNLFITLQKFIFDSPVIFFVSVMLTEPLTTPPTRTKQILYGSLVGFLFAPQLHLGSVYSTPEIALCLGNIYSYFNSSKRIVLKFKEKIKLSSDVYDYVFTSNKKLNFLPGQYMEWTLGHEQPDSRGNRRYFTIASSPTEKNIRVGIKFHSESSSFKANLMQMSKNSEIIASQLAGDFVLPKDSNSNCVFIAGGIGITPFRSMIKYLLDTNQKRPVTLFYTNKTEDEIVYRDVFDTAQKKLGIKTIYSLTDSKKVSPNWKGHTGRVTVDLIKANIPDFTNTYFYLSGPHSMVVDFEKTLKELYIPSSQIITDYFPGFT